MSGPATTYRECGSEFDRQPGTPRVCESCLPAFKRWLVREGTPIPRVAYPEDLYPGDPDVARVKRAALRCGRLWRTQGEDDGKRYRRAIEKLDAALERCGVPQVRFFAQVTLLDGRFNGATGGGAYIAVASRVCNERARAELNEPRLPQRYLGADCLKALAGRRAGPRPPTPP